jgi:hypothetical protein
MKMSSTRPRGEEFVFGPPTMTTTGKNDDNGPCLASGAQLFDFLMDPRSGEPPGKKTPSSKTRLVPLPDFRAKNKQYLVQNINFVRE